jgi:Lipocalin-like domain
MSIPIKSDHPIVGTWRLTSFSEQNLDTGEIRYPFGEAASALVIYEANGYVATIFAAADRKPPRAPQATDQEAIDLYRSMISFAGRYELSGNRLIYHPEISWNEAWNGTTQERVIEVSKDRLQNQLGAGDQPIDGRENGFLTRVGASTIGG